MKFACERVGLDFLERAPRRVEARAPLAIGCDEAFALLEDGPAWVEWFEEIEDVTWTSARPFGVGTTRTVTLQTMTVHEYFIAWEPGRRFTFRFDHASLPAFGAFVEDYVLEPRGEGACELLWTAYWRPSKLTVLGAGLLQRQLQDMFDRAAASLSRHVSERAGA